MKNFLKFLNKGENILIVSIGLVLILIMFLYYNKFFNNQNGIIDKNISQEQFEKDLGIENIEINKNNKTNYISFDNGKIKEINENYFILELQNSKTYTSSFSDDLKALFKKNNISINDNIIISYNEKKEPLNVYKYDGKIYNKIIGLSDIEKLINLSIYDNIELNSYNKNFIEKNELLSLLKNQISTEDVKIEEYNIPYYFYIENTSTNKPEKIELNTINNIFISYFKLSNGKIFISFVKNNNLYKKEDVIIYQNYINEKMGISDKEVLEKLYLKYQTINKSLFF